MSRRTAPPDRCPPPTDTGSPQDRSVPTGACPSHRPPTPGSPPPPSRARHTSPRLPPYRRRPDAPQPPPWEWRTPPFSDSPADPPPKAPAHTTAAEKIPAAPSPHRSPVPYSRRTPRRDAGSAPAGSPDSVRPRRSTAPCTSPSHSRRRCTPCRRHRTGIPPAGSWWGRCTHIPSPAPPPQRHCAPGCPSPRPQPSPRRSLTPPRQTHRSDRCRLHRRS